jgi:hypothetical protein
MKASTRNFLIMFAGGALGALTMQMAINFYERRLASLDQQITRAADNINRQLPMMLDRNTEILALGGSAGTLQYSYRLLNVTLSTADTADLLASLRPRVRNQACTAPEIRETFIDRGVTVRFAYADKDYRRLFAVEVSSADCSKDGGA